MVFETSSDSGCDAKELRAALRSTIRPCSLWHSLQHGADTRSNKRTLVVSTLGLFAAALFTLSDPAPAYAETCTSTLVTTCGCQTQQWCIDHTPEDCVYDDKDCGEPGGGCGAARNMACYYKGDT